MSRPARFFFFLLVVASLLGFGAVLLNGPDPVYRVQEWMSGGHYAEYDEMIRGAARRYKVDPLLVKAIAWRESKFSPEKVGGSGERGLMQIMEIAAKDWAKSEKIETFVPTDLFDPKTNLDAGAWYLSRSYERWKNRDDPIPFVLAEYNAGKKRVDRWIAQTGHADKATAAELLEKMDFPSTRQYIDDVIGRRDYYRQRGRM